MYRKLIPLLAAVALLAAACSTVFTSSISGVVYDAVLYEDGTEEPVAGADVYLYRRGADRDDDLADLNAGTPASRFFDRTTTDAGGEFTLNFVWNSLFPEFGETADREEVAFIVHDPDGDYSTATAEAVIVSEFIADLRVLMTAARASASVTGLVRDASTGNPVEGVTVTGFLPVTRTYSGSTGVSVSEWSTESTFLATTDVNGRYTASYSFPRLLEDDETGTERSAVRLLFSRSGYRVAADADSDLSSGVDVDGDGVNDVYLESGSTLAGIQTTLAAVSLKPNEFTGTLRGQVFIDGSNGGALDGVIEAVEAANGLTVRITVTDPDSGGTSEYQTTSRREGIDGEDGEIDLSGITWSDSDYGGTQSLANATISVDGYTVVLPAAAVSLIGSDELYVNVLVQ